MALDIEMNKIAFDLDGVFIPDCDPIPNVGGLGEFLSMTVYMRPMFKPDFEWHIITGRPARYRATTIDWINKHKLKHLPQYHNLIRCEILTKKK